jgi:hypothetical protein
MRRGKTKDDAEEEVREGEEGREEGEDCCDVREMRVLERWIMFVERGESS